MSTGQDPKTSEFITNEFRKVIAGGVAFKTVRAPDDFTIEVYLPDLISATKASHLWTGLTGEPERPLPASAIAANGKREPVLTFFFEDFAQNHSGLRFLEAAGPSLEIHTCHADDAGKAHSSDIESQFSPGAENYRRVSSEFEAKLHSIAVRAGQRS